jgi:hypothetical protein
MNAEEARAILEAGAEDEEPVGLPPDVLDELTIADVPAGVSVQVGSYKDGVLHLEWEGRLTKDEEQVIGEADYTWTRKYWYSPLGLEHYLDLVRRAVEVRQKEHGDVELIHFEDDGAVIRMVFMVHSGEKNLGKAFHHVKSVCEELEEAAEDAADQVGRLVAELAGRVSGWGSRDLDALVVAVERATSADERGRSLEELVGRLFEAVPGFTVTGRIRTATEEIDIAILNGSDDPRFRRESAILLAECKNWSDKCGKDEFVLFKEKIENRSNRCSIGFLISWNGFKSTVTKEMLRGSRETTLVVPMSGKEIRSAIRYNNFADVLASCWQQAVNT